MRKTITTAWPIRHWPKIGAASAQHAKNMVTVELVKDFQAMQTLNRLQPVFPTRMFACTICSFHIAVSSHKDPRSTKLFGHERPACQNQNTFSTTYVINLYIYNASMCMGHLLHQD
jgi:hypothetical protein